MTSSARFARLAALVSPTLHGRHRHASDSRLARSAAVGICPRLFFLPRRSPPALRRLALAARGSSSPTRLESRTKSGLRRERHLLAVGRRRLTPTRFRRVPALSTRRVAFTRSSRSASTAGHRGAKWGGGEEEEVRGTDVWLGWPTQ